MVNPKLNSAIRLIALVVLLGVAVYIFILGTSDDINELKQKISRLSTGDLIVPIGFSLTSYFLRFLRWRLILRRLGYSLPFKIDLIYYLSGFALTMTPGKSGETIRSAFLLQAQVPIRVSLSAFVIERSFDLLIVGLLATLLFAPVSVTLALFIAALVAISLVSARLAREEWQGNSSRLPKILRIFLDAISRASVALKPQSTVIYALLGCAAWASQGIGFFAIVGLFSQDIGVFKAISTYCAGLFIGAASLIPGGIGVTEGSLSWLLQAQGLDQNSAILSALISRGCTLWLAVAVGCTALAAIIKGQTVAEPTT